MSENPWHGSQRRFPLLPRWLSIKKVPPEVGVAIGGGLLSGVAISALDTFMGDESLLTVAGGFGLMASVGGLGGALERRNGVLRGLLLSATMAVMAVVASDIWEHVVPDDTGEVATPPILATDLAIATGIFGIGYGGGAAGKRLLSGRR